MKSRFFLVSAVMLMNCVGAYAQSVSLVRGDVNGDGHVDVADVTDVVSIIMSDTNNSSDAAETDQRKWNELMKLPSREEIDSYNATSSERSPYIGAWLHTDIEGNFTMFSVDFKADYLPSATYCSLASFNLDYSSVMENGDIVSVTPNSTVSGYAGFQRNSTDPKRYNSIMSFWDVACERSNGETETVTPKLVWPKDTQESVFTHEGNGVNFLPAFTWKAHKWYRMMLVCAESETSGNTIVEQWLYDISNNSWTKICAYDCGLPNLTFKGHTCVFLENFSANSSGEIRTLEFKNARVYNHEAKKWTDIESAYFFNQGNLPGSYQYGSDGSSYWMITTGVPNCADSQEPGMIYVKNTESGKPY